MENKYSAMKLCKLDFEFNGNCSGLISVVSYSYFARVMNMKRTRTNSETTTLRNYNLHDKKVSIKEIYKDD